MSAAPRRVPHDALLLDTHVFLWWADGELPRISREARDAIVAAPSIYVSLASAWELTIKSALRKMRLSVSFSYALDVNNFGALPISLAHIERVASLPAHHRDPFDRLLIAQAAHEGLTLVTHDDAFRAYPVPVLWT
ncbi:twitching motility protein PilT [Gemmatimonadetes bacterium T265]|nr:twitching motility protein PilT [Gemmatimonadetes bacterium T265]